MFASIAIRALNDHPEFATPHIIDGIQKLTKGFHGVVPGRGYYGKQKGWIIGDKVKLTEKENFPAYKSFHSMANVVVDDLIQKVAQRRRGFGGMVHVINHAAALVELSQYGFQELAKKGLAAHHQHVQLWRSLPDLSKELGKVRKSKHDPRTPNYWEVNAKSQASANLTHRIKLLYGFFTLLKYIEDPKKRQKAEEQFLYLMA